jgi:hypothetical protein
VVYAFVLTQRQRRAATAQARANRASSAQTAATKGGATKQAGARRAGDRTPRRARKGAAQTGPAASSRYTPPKPKRPRRPPASESADQGRKWWGRASDT